MIEFLFQQNWRKPLPSHIGVLEVQTDIAACDADEMKEAEKVLRKLSKEDKLR